MMSQEEDVTEKLDLASGIFENHLVMNQIAEYLSLWDLISLRSISRPLKLIAERHLRRVKTADLRQIRNKDSAIIWLNKYAPNLLELQLSTDVPSLQFRQISTLNQEHLQRFRLSRLNLPDFLPLSRLQPIHIRERDADNRIHVQTQFLNLKTAQEQLKRLRISSELARFLKRFRELLSFTFSNLKHISCGNGVLTAFSANPEASIAFFQRHPTLKTLVLERKNWELDSVFQANRNVFSFPPFASLIDAANLELETLISLPNPRLLQNNFAFFTFLHSLRRLNLGFLDCEPSGNAWLNDAQKSGSFFRSLENLEEFAFAVETLSPEINIHYATKLKLLAIQFESGDPDFPTLDDHRHLENLHLVCIAKRGDSTIPRFTSNCLLKEITIGTLDPLKKGRHVELNFGADLSRSLCKMSILADAQRLEIPFALPNLKSLTLPELGMKIPFEKATQLEELQLGSYLFYYRELSAMLDKFPLLQRINVYTEPYQGFLDSEQVREYVESTLQIRGGALSFCGKWAQMHPELIQYKRQFQL